MIRRDASEQSSLEIPRIGDEHIDLSLFGFDLRVKPIEVTVVAHVGADGLDVPPIEATAFGRSRTRRSSDRSDRGRPAQSPGFVTTH
jgi:hypothetical protein